MNSTCAGSVVLTAMLLASGAVGQTFEVATVRLASAAASAKDEYSAGYNAGARAALSVQGLRIRGDRVRVTDNTLKDLIRLAYGVKEHQIIGPPWIAQEKYDIEATMPVGGTREQAPEMLQALLRERFQLQLHRESREMQVYALEAAKGGPKLVAVAAGTRGSSSSRPGRVIGTAAPMSTLAELLTKAESRPVLDMTGITGLFNFDLRYTAEPNDVDGGPSLVTALTEQLGLRLERRKLPMEVLVVDGANRVPVEN